MNINNVIKMNYEENAAKGYKKTKPKQTQFWNLWSRKRSRMGGNLKSNSKLKT